MNIILSRITIESAKYGFQCFSFSSKDEMIDAYESILENYSNYSLSGGNAKELNDNNAFFFSIEPPNVHGSKMMAPIIVEHYFKGEILDSVINELRKEHVQ